MSRILPILIGETGLSARDILRITANAPTRYKRFKIPKRNGQWRQISQPARELKALQRALISSFLIELPVHNAAKAYRNGLSIADNAAPHSHNGPILKYDFRDFFPSIRSRDWQRYCERLGSISAEDIYITQQILFQRDRGSRILKLSIGAPSSPILSNILMYDFDEAITRAVENDRVVYTRYADDLTFSAPRTGFLNGVDQSLRKVIKENPWPKLEINEQKTVLATKKYRRQITGLVLTNDGKVSIGREKKRAVRATIHRATMGLLSPEEMSHLCGMLAYVKSVEPEFLERMEKHYGQAIFLTLKQHAAVSRRAIKQTEAMAWLEG